MSKTKANGTSVSSKASSGHSTTVFDLLETLPRISLDRLYGLGGEDEGRTTSTTTKPPPTLAVTKGQPAAASQPQQQQQNPYPWTCRAVFQCLSPLAKQYVMRLLCIEGTVTKACLESWVEARCLETHRQAIRKLDRLRILQALEEDPHQYTLNTHFRTNLRAALSSHLAGPWSDPRIVLKPDPAPKTPLQLESYMCAKWNAVLHFLVGSTEAGFDEPADEVQRFLKDTGLMAVPSGVGGKDEGKQEDEDDSSSSSSSSDDDDDDDEEEEEEESRRPEKDGVGDGGQARTAAGRQSRRKGKKRKLRITNAGVDFLLKDVHVQVWRFVEYIISHEEGSRDEILTFLFQLSYCRVGKYYPVAALTPAQQLLLNKFTSFGLIYRRSETSSRFYPTAVAVNLIFGAHMSSSSSRYGAGARAVPKELRLVDPNQLAIIVETNYQIVAYTTSSLHVEMLRIFADIRCRLPNVVMGFITRAGIRRAMASGITARTILSFLKSHVHPAVRAKKQARLLPENVEAQIELWHRERARVKFEEVMMMDLSRLTWEDFEEVCEYAEHLAVVAWRTRFGGSLEGDGGSEDDDSEGEEDDAGGGGRRRPKKLLAVRPEGLDRIRTFVEDREYSR